MPALDGHIFLGYDPLTGNPTYFPAIPSPDDAWYDHTDNETGADIIDPCTGALVASVAVQDPEGAYNYLVPKITDTVTSHRAIAIRQIVYDYCAFHVKEAGYPELDGDTFLTVGDAQFRMAMAMYVPRRRFDLIAFETTPALSEGETVVTYTPSVAIVLGIGFTGNEILNPQVFA